MQTTRKTGDKITKRETTKDDPPKKNDEKHKTIPTSRNFIRKSTTADIYSRNSSQNKNISSKTNIAIGSLKSSPSSISQNSSRSLRNKIANTSKTSSARDIKVTKNSSKNLPMNVTVNSPIQRKKELIDNKFKKSTSKDIGLNSNKNATKKVTAKDIGQDLKAGSIDNLISKEAEFKSKQDLTKQVLIPARQRTSTRTLDEEEIKVLTPDVVDNNAELLNLTKKLSAKPKSFYVDLNDDLESQQKKQKSSDDEVSYEDDFESYESDFDSYKSDETGDSSDEVKNDSDDENDKSDKSDDECTNNMQAEDEDGNSKEEKMLDSGNFELRDQRSANRSKPMDFISEVSEENDGKSLYDESDKKVSLTDEGFQDMSSGLSSIKTIHVDVLDRPLFIDFTKSKENRRKKRIFEKLKQRATDILSMVTLHEMSYNLFEMAPIPYDLYMATFGRSNYTQTSVQTFDDGITEEVQTDEVLHENKWTQCPVDFSHKDICLNNSKQKEHKILEQFSFFNDVVNEEEANENFKNDPLRVFLEQKDGAGSDKIMPYDSYKKKLKANKYDVIKLKKFLKKVESKISSVLYANAGNTEMSNLIKTSKFPFSMRYLLISTKNIESFLKNSKIIGAVLSENKHNLIMTVHEKFKSGVVCGKCVLCLWDQSVAIREPLKILIATDNVQIGRFRGNTDGYFVGALEDGSIHLWDLSEEPTWCSDPIEETSTQLVEVESKDLTQTERDREWNMRNSSCVKYEDMQNAFQACSYTSSAMAVCNNEDVNNIVGLEFIGDNGGLGDGKKMMCQLCSLQYTGILTIWSIIQEKCSTEDMGKAFWSKLKLERNQIIKLTDYINVPINNETNFNLTGAKKRLSIKKQERNLKIPRPKSAIKNIERPSSAANLKNKVLTNNNVFDFFRHGVEFNHLKVMNMDGVNHFLVAINYGEVLCCRRILGNIIVKRISVANAASSITRIETSPHNLPYFLAATDCGTVNLCSLADCRVLLTLDCRNIPNSTVEKCQADHKGRFIGSVDVKSPDEDSLRSWSINSLSWSHTDPFCITAVCDRVCVWELAHSDIQTSCTSGGIAECCSTSERALALLTTEDDVHIYKLNDEKKNLDLFEKYIALL